MTRCAQVRQLAMALAGVEEKAHFGTPSWRVGGKMFAEARADGSTAIFKLSKMHQEILFETRPQTFTPAIWGAIRWCRIALDGVAADELKELVREAYDEVTRKPAPKASARRTAKPRR
jgi:predicted DNA-binding protein (MmcQ/YjbR family)